MKTKDIINQLESLQSNSRSFITDDSDEIWNRDIEALDAAIGIIRRAEKAGIVDEVEEHDN